MSKNLKGFTLIEVLIYLALFTLLMVGALAGVYQIIASTDKMSQKIFIEQEGNYLLRKIDWALTGATVISSPVVNNSGPVLNLTKPSLGLDNPLEFTLNSDRISLSRNGSANDISSDFLTVYDLVFTYIDPDGQGGTPGQVTASFKINGQVFETTKYLRK